MSNLPPYEYRVELVLHGKEYELLAEVLQPGNFTHLSRTGQNRAKALWRKFRAGKWNRERDLPLHMQKLLAVMFAPNERETLVKEGDADNTHTYALNETRQLAHEKKGRLAVVPGAEVTPGPLPPRKGSRRRPVNAPLS